RRNEIKKAYLAKLFQCFQRLLSIAPVKLKRLVSASKSAELRCPSSLLISNHSLHSSQERLLPVNTACTRPMRSALPSPQLYLPGLNGPLYCRASSNCSGAGNRFVILETSSANA